MSNTLPIPFTTFYETITKDPKAYAGQTIQVDALCASPFRDDNGAVYIQLADPAARHTRVWPGLAGALRWGLSIGVDEPMPSAGCPLTVELLFRANGTPGQGTILHRGIGSERTATQRQEVDGRVSFAAFLARWDDPMPHYEGYLRVRGVLRKILLNEKPDPATTGKHAPLRTSYIYPQNVVVLFAENDDPTSRVVELLVEAASTQITSISIGEYGTMYVHVDAIHGHDEHARYVSVAWESEGPAWPCEVCNRLDCQVRGRYSWRGDRRGTLAELDGPPRLFAASHFDGGREYPGLSIELEEGRRECLGRAIDWRTRARAYAVLLNERFDALSMKDSEVEAIDRETRATPPATPIEIEKHIEADTLEKIEAEARAGATAHAYVIPAGHSLAIIPYRVFASWRGDYQADGRAGGDRYPRAFDVRSLFERAAPKLPAHRIVPLNVEQDRVLVWAPAGEDVRAYQEANEKAVWR